MKNSCPTDHSPAVFLLFLLCLLLYHATIQYGWHLDDPPNILLNQSLHITDLHPATLVQTFFAHPVSPGSLFRPVANFSFSLNWFFGQDQASGYHIVNIAIHFSTAVMLYLCCILLLQTPVQKTIPSELYSSVALLTATLWLVAPIHTQAVTYIVQRMAQLATLFSITAIFFYLLFRLSGQLRQRILYAVLCFLSAALAIGSKENAILLPGSILLVEFIFWEHGSSLLSMVIKNKKKSAGLLFCAALACIYLIRQYGTGIFNYDHRNFTLVERILTEPRILLFYLFQIFFPSTTSLSIEHDVPLSTSLFSPWATLPAVILCTGLILISIVRIRKTPLLSFAILFFFFNHIIESTVIHLELIFEHRNYLPSLFLFFPIATFIVQTTCPAAPNKQTKTVTIGTSAACIFFLILAGLTTYQRNRVWQNDFTLWQDAAQKAPLNGRARLNLAGSYLAKKQYARALELCNQAEQLQGATKNKLVPISLSIKGDIAYAQGNVTLAASRFQEAFSLRHDYTDVFYKLVAVLIEQEQYDQALSMVEDRYEDEHEANLLLLKATLLLRLNLPEKALQTYQDAARAFKPNRPSLIVEGMAKALSMQGHFSQADRLLSRAVKSNSDVFLLLIENSLNSGATDKAAREMRQLLQLIPLTRLMHFLNQPLQDAYQVPVNRPLLKQALLASAEKMTEDLPEARQEL